MKRFAAMSLFLGFALSICLGSPKLVEIKFYGFEDPRRNLYHPHITFKRKDLKHFSSDLSQLEEIGEASLQPLDGRHFHVSLIYKGGSPRVLSLYPLDSVIVIEELGTWWKVEKKNEGLFRELLKRSIFLYQEQHEMLLSDKQVFTSIEDEDSLLEEVHLALELMRLSTEGNNEAKEIITQRGSGLIYRYSVLYERYYNFSRVRQTILNGFQELARDLEANGFPVILKHSGINYRPQFEIMRENGEWVCYVGDCLVFGHMVKAYDQFNQVTSSPR